MSQLLHQWWPAPALGEFPSLPVDQVPERGARSLTNFLIHSDGKIIPPQVKAARMGAYPQAIREFLETEQLEAALDVINQWDETFPTEKPKGHTLFWRGKASHLRGQHRDAARWLAKSIRLATGAAFETEARWLRCASLLEAGQSDIARKELVQLAKFPLADRFTQLAKERLSSLK